MAFVDFGHSKLCVTLASFMQDKIKIIATHSGRNLGARNMDYLLYQYFSKEFEKKHKLDLNENPRARLRLLDNIEKVRKLLTSNKEADLVVEALMDDIDFHKMLTRSEFENIVADVIANISETLKMALALSGLGVQHINCVELIGEASRIPIVIETIKQVFCRQDISRTMNSTDCIARGCAIQAAMLNPMSRMTPI